MKFFMFLLSLGETRTTFLVNSKNCMLHGYIWHYSTLLKSTVACRLFRKHLWFRVYEKSRRALLFIKI